VAISIYISGLQLLPRKNVKVQKLNILIFTLIVDGKNTEQVGKMGNE